MWTAADAKVQVPAGMLPEVRESLERKRGQIDAELREVGMQPKSSTHAIFNQCRLFDSAFRKKLMETDTTNHIREAFLGKTGLRENIHGLGLNKFFDPMYVRQVCKQADGYQKHLVSPEKGLRLLLKEAIGYVTTPAEQCVTDVKFILVQTVGKAANDFSRFTHAEEAASLKPTTQQMLVEIAMKAIDQWGDKASDVATKLVSMEGDYITASFFRRIAEDRERGEGDGFGSDEPETPKQAVPDESLANLNLFGGSAKDYMMGFLEKNSESHTMAPLDSWKWQKRWFVLSETKRKLYYFKDPDELPHYRGVIDMSNCIVEDLAADSAKSREANSALRNGSANGSSSFSLLLSLSSKDPNLPILKDHTRVILRTENASSKYEWLARLRECTVAAAQASQASSVARRSSVSSLAEPTTPPKKKLPSRRNTSMPHISPVKSVWGDLMDEEPLGKARRGSPLSAYFTHTLRGKTDLDAAFFETLSQDLSLYTHMVLESLFRSVPKAVVHCMVKHAECEMLEEMYRVVNELSREQLESLTFEESATTQRRAALLNAAKDLDSAIDGTAGLMSSISGLLDETENVEISSYALELAGMLDSLGERSTKIERVISRGPYTPKALKGGVSQGFRASVKPPVPQFAAPQAKQGLVRVQPHAPSPAQSGASTPSVEAPAKVKPRRRPPPPPPRK